jgi:1-acyl-sn-glycerol-3-phosphate acyltransferase
LNLVRSLVFHLLQVLSVIPWALGTLVWSVTPVMTRHKLTSAWPALMVHLAHWICGVRWQVHGLENLPAGSVLFAPKHQSVWETYYLMGLCPKPVCFVFKRELHFIPFFGWGIAGMRMIAIDRKRGRDSFEQVVKQGEQNMAWGRNLLMFPEGTRIPVGMAGQYKSGAARFAIRTNVPIVPIAVTSGRCWPRKSLILRPGTIHVSYGPPISPQGHTPDSMMVIVRDWVEAEMHRLTPEDY